MTLLRAFRTLKTIRAFEERGIPETQKRDVGGALLERVTVFDLYRGDGVAEGHRSLAFRLRLQAWDRTLRDKEVDRVVEKIVKHLREDLGVEQRL